MAASRAIVRVAGREWTQGDGAILAATVTLNQGREASKASIKVADPFLSEFTAIPDPYKNSRVPVEIFGGNEPGPAFPKLFAGYVSKLDAQGGEGAPGTLAISAVDKAKGLRRVDRARNLTDTSAAQLIETLIEESGELELVFQGTAREDLDRFTYSQQVQPGISDLELIHLVLRQLGHTYKIVDNQIRVRGVGAQIDPPTLVLTTGASGNVARYQFGVAEITRRTTPRILNQAGEDVFAPEDLEGLDPEVTARVTALERAGITFDAADLPSFSDQALELARESAARARRIYEGQLTLDGLYPSVEPGSQVLLRGWGAKLTGVWNVERVRHDLAPTGTTTIHVFNGGASD